MKERQKWKVLKIMVIVSVSFIFSPLVLSHATTLLIIYIGHCTNGYFNCPAIKINKLKRIKASHLHLLIEK